MVQKYTESVDFEDSQKHYKAPMERLTDTIGGLAKGYVVPRARVELATRGFSVRQEHLLLEMLTHLIALGQVAEQLKQDLGSNGHHPNQVTGLIQ